MVLMAPKRLISKIVFMRASLASSSEASREMPALLTSTSMRPKILTASATALWMADREAVTSRSSTAMDSVLRWDRRVEALRPVAMTWSPRAAMAWARASPEPDVQPVMSQTSVGIAAVVLSRGSGVYKRDT